MKLTHGAFILARYSTDNQDQDSIEVQVEKCSAWCQKEDIPVLDVFADYAVSGMKDSRPQFERMMQQLQQGRADTVVILDQSRMFRKMIAWFSFRDELEKLGVRVVSVTQPNIGGDLRDPSNFLVEGSMALFNQMWVLQTRQKVVDKMRFMAKNGIHTGGTPPLGYQVVDRRLAVDPDEAIVVQQIFQRYADGDSYRQIIEWLNNRGIRTKRGNAFGVNSLHDMLNNKKYIGTLVYGRVSQQANGKRNNHSRSEDIIELEDACPAIIEKELWEKVHAKLEKNRRTGGPRPKAEGFFLQKKVFCGECGAPMNIHYASGDRHNVYYTCSARKRTHVCQCRPIRADWLGETVCSRIRDAIGTPDSRSGLYGILRNQRQNVAAGAGEKMESLVRRRSDIAKQLDHAADALLSGLKSPTLLEKISKLEAEKEGLDFQINRLHQEVMQATISDQEMESALDLIFSPGVLHSEAIASIIYRVEVGNDLIRVWTIIDLDPDSKHEPAEIRPEDLPMDPGIFGLTVQDSSAPPTVKPKVIMTFVLHRQEIAH